MILSKLDETKLDAKRDLLERAVAVGDRLRSPNGLKDGALASLLSQYYRHVPPDELLDRDPQDLYGAALAQYSLAGNRPQGRAIVRVYTPTVEGEGWSSGHTTIEIVTDDMPFLVDSVAAELTGEHRSIHVVIHPQLAVRRTITGELVEVCPEADAPPADALLESWMHVEIDRESDQDALEDIQAELVRVLGDVRDVVEDWQKMRATAVGIADSLES